MTEHEIQNAIRLETTDIATLFRINVGKFTTNDGRFIQTGVPVGFSDLFGFRHSDGKAVFIEVKKPDGKASEKQKNFISKMVARGANAGIARSVEEAREIINN